MLTLALTTGFNDACDRPSLSAGSNRGSGADTRI
jgi:hypothetical protein